MAKYLLLPFFVLCIIRLSAAGYCEADNEEIYSYHGSTNGPRQWPTLFPDCDGDSQSPINIQTNRVQRDSRLKKLNFFGYDTSVKQAEVENNGHTVMITPQDNVSRGITFQGQNYSLLQLHFHWGPNYNPGGEHTLNGRKFEMEIHFVHRSSDNKTAVVGVLVELQRKSNSAFKPITKVLSKVMYKDDTTQLKSSLNLNQIIPESPASFYGYSGSLTTPMCTEGVTWFVLKETETIGWKQLDSFLKVYSVEKEDRSINCLLAPNNRPRQDLNNRVVYESE